MSRCENDPNRLCNCPAVGVECVLTEEQAHRAACAFLDAEDTAALHNRLAQPAQSTIAAEAQGMVYGDREDDYGHPREDFTRTAVIWTGLLQHKLAEGAFIEPEDIARCQIGVKLARDVNSPKRDNRTDMVGYAITLDRLETGR